MTTTLATSAQIPGELSFYNIVLFVHIAAAIIAFGVTFAYPIIDVAIRRADVRSLPALHRAQGKVGKLLITPAATVLLLAGIYLAATGPYDFSESFVSAGFVIIVVLLGLGGAFFAPTERKLAELADRDVAAGGDGPVAMSAEYERLARRLANVGILASVLVLLAVFLMVVRP